MEIWKDVKNYEGMYQVSNLGLVKSLERKVIAAQGFVQTYPGKTLKHDVLTTTYSNYQRVTLSRNNKVSRHSVHRLVAEAFIPNTEDKPHVNHLDNNAENNTVENLEWCTHSENMQHAQKQGRLFKSQSSGGCIGGAVSKQLRLSSVASLQGTYVGDWFVNNQPYWVKGKKAYLSCKCTCGTEQAIEVTRLIREETKNCRACGQRHRNR